MAALLLAMGAAHAAVHSADAAQAVTAIGAPVLVVLEGDARSSGWQRVSGWIEADVRLLARPAGADIDDAVAAGLAQTGLRCAVHLRQVRQGWEGALHGDCGAAALPAEMALTASPPGADTVWGLSSTIRHGARIGYAYTRDDRLAAPHLAVMGYEVCQEVRGGEGLDVLMVGNVSISGINQSVALPSASALLGVELSDALQLGVGPSLRWGAGEADALHMIVAAGWTAEAGALRVPLHAAWIPDVAGRDSYVLTTGVTF